MANMRSNSTQLLLRSSETFDIIISQILEHLPRTTARFNHWLYLLSDQNLNLYTPQDFLVFILPLYLEIFLLSLIYYRPPGFPRNPNPGAYDYHTSIIIFSCLSWLFTAIEHVWIQPDFSGMCLAVVDVCVEYLCVIMLQKVMLFGIAVLANWVFGWRALSGAKEGIAPSLLHAAARSNQTTVVQVVMGSLRFGEFADSPTVFLPQQQPVFFPSAYTHLIQHHQPWKPIMERDTLAPSRCAPLSTAPKAPPASSLKRSREESPAECAAFTKSKVQRRESSDSLQDEGMTEVFAPVDRATSRPGEHQSWLDERTEWPIRHRETMDFQNREEGRRECQDHGAELIAQFGVGWYRPKAPEWHAAAQGWAKFIAKTFPMNNVKVVAGHTDGSLLVVVGDCAVTDGVYVFDQDATVGTRIARSWEECGREISKKHGFRWEGRELCHPTELSSWSEPSKSARADSEGKDAMSTSSTAPLPSSPPVAPSGTQPFSPGAMSRTSIPPAAKDGSGTAVSGETMEVGDVEMAMY
ncbi:MAG: hypothetical protein Q9210_001376 [Variospora velana]